MSSPFNRITKSVLATAALFVFFCCPIARGDAPTFTIVTGVGGNTNYVSAANNLIAGMDPVYLSNPNAGETNDTGNVSKLTDGQVVVLKAEAYTIGTDAVITYELGGLPSGYDVTEINIWAGWGDGNRMQVNVGSIEYSLDSDPLTFIALENSNVSYSGYASPTLCQTAVQYVFADLVNVHSVRFNFGGQQMGYAGYREIEIIGTYANADGRVIISGVPEAYGAPTPAYGMMDELELDDTVEFSMPSGWIAIGDGVRAQCVGYNVYTNEVLVDAGTESSFTYTHLGVQGHVEWLFDTQYRVQASVQGNGTVAISGSAVSDGWATPDSTVSFEVTPKGLYRFVAWQSEGVSLEDATLNPISVVVSAPVSMTAVLDGNILVNGSFENSAYMGDSYTYCSAAPGYPIANWTHWDTPGRGGAGIATVGSPWVQGSSLNLELRHGKYLAFLQEGATISQTFTCTVSGTYELSFLACNRYSYQNYVFDIEIDNTWVATVTVPSEVLSPFVIEVPFLELGDHTLTLGVNGYNPPDSPDAVAFDNVVLRLVSGDDDEEEEEEPEPLTETQTTEVPVPYVWLDSYFPSASADYEAAALATAANGRTVWECYLIGLDPTDINATFTATIDIQDNQVIIGYDPDLGDARTYKIHGKEELTSSWTYPTNSASRFFKVQVELPPAE